MPPKRKNTLQKAISTNNDASWRRKKVKKSTPKKAKHFFSLCLPTSLIILSLIYLCQSFRRIIVDQSINEEDAVLMNPRQLQHFDNQHHEKDSSIWVAGLVMDPNTIQDKTWDFLITLNCKYQFNVHVIVKEDKEEALKALNAIKNLQHPNVTDSCAAFIFQQESEKIWENGHNPQNRIDRLSVLRDYQRNSLMNAVQNNKNGLHNDKEEENSIIIFADLDLKELPSIDEIVKQANSMKDPKYPHDAICSTGLLMKDSRKNRKGKIPFYYDTFATVFQPDTFSFPRRGRLVPRLYKGEDEKFVESSRRRREDYNRLYSEILKAAEQSVPTGNLQVRSCFGGLTMYRSKVYFDERCMYKLRISDDEVQKPDPKSLHLSIMRYAIKDEHRPCEHVVLHDCLVRENPQFNIAINPKLVTQWQQPS